jgi:TPR repeat protein
MHLPKRTIALSLAILLPASLLAISSATAQTEPAAAPLAPLTQSVTVTGSRGQVGESTLITAAKSKVLSRTLASGCNYMSAYSAAEDDVTLAYMRDRGLEDSASNEAERFRENSPNGDASNADIASSIVNDAVPGDPLGKAAGGCGPGDRNFAAARNRIARKDKSLAEAFVAFDAKDFATARAQATIAYNKIGYDEAGLLLAQMDLNGLGAPKNTPQAIVWLKKVVEARFDPMRDMATFDPKDPEALTPRVEATLLLAKIYLRGIGTAKDPAEANKWYAKAVSIGFVPANNTLGMAAMNGFGGARSVPKAIGYFKLAAQEGYAPSEYNLAKIYYTGEDGVPQDLKLAGAWFAAAAKMGHPGALYAAGRMYDLGQGVPADQKKAIVYYKEAAVKANADAQSALATYFYSGEVVPKDLATARKLFTAAAQQGQPDAMFNLGVMSANGEAGTKDMAMAYVWLSLSQKSGNDSAAAAIKQIGPMLSAADRTRVDLVLKPKPKG